ncbi:hypothetical protein L7F22_045489 [Adiantum nelumboides]|nr:hypothetical protein [Adiantum nelumboides]
MVERWEPSLPQLSCGALFPPPPSIVQGSLLSIKELNFHSTLLELDGIALNKDENSKLPILN